MDKRLKEALMDYHHASGSLFGKYARSAYYIGDNEDFHQLRVAVKKLRTLMLLADLSGGKCTDRIGDLLRQFFASAGLVRDLLTADGVAELYEKQVNTSFPAVRKYLRDQTLVAHYAYRRVFEQCMVKVPGVSDELGNLLTEIPNTKIRNAINRFFERIPAGMALLYRQKEYHAMRKQIKHLRYILEILQSAKTTDNIVNCIDTLKKYEGLLGFWHDRYDLLGILDKFNASMRNEGKNYMFKPDRLRELVATDIFVSLHDFESVYRSDEIASICIQSIKYK